MMKAESELEIMHEIIRSAVWSVAYHERELNLAHSVSALTVALMKRCGTERHPDALKKYEDDDEDGGNCRTTDDFAQYLLGKALWNILHHEEALQSAHRTLAVSKALLLRTGLDISVSEIEESQRKCVAGNT